MIIHYNKDGVQHFKQMGPRALDPGVLSLDLRDIIKKTF